jgi:hypothetical protein
MGPRKFGGNPWIGPDQTQQGLTFERELGQIPVLPNAPKGARFSRSKQAPGTATIFDPHHYAKFNGEIAIAVPNGSAVVVASQPSSLRNMCQLRNASATANIYVSFGAVASLNSLLKLLPGDQILYDVVCPQDEVSAYADAASAVLVFAQSTTPGES